LASRRVEDDKLDLARELIAEAAKRNVAFLCCRRITSSLPRSRTGVETETVVDIPNDRMGLDIGPRTIADFIDRLAGARTVIWKRSVGPLRKTPPSRKALSRSARRSPI